MGNQPSMDSRHSDVAAAKRANAFAFLGTSHQEVDEAHEAHEDSGPLSIKGESAPGAPPTLSAAERTAKSIEDRIKRSMSRTHESVDDDVNNNSDRNKNSGTRLRARTLGARELEHSLLERRQQASEMESRRFHAA